MAHSEQRRAHLFGVMAHPVAQSLSPMMHNAAFKGLQLPHYYHAFDVQPTHLQTAMEALKILGIKGVNITIPHKESVLHYIDQVDEEAQAIGAVNTIVRSADGELIGYNTDGAGYVRSLQTETNIDLTTAHALVIGAGGAAKGISIYLLKSGCAQLTVMNRTPSKAKQLVRQLKEYANQHALQVEVTTTHWRDVFSGKEDPYTLLINTTSVGMWPNSTETSIQIKDMGPHIVVSDIVYNPLKTKLLQEAEEAGATIHQGLGMFIHQGALAFKYFTGEEAPVELMRHVILDHLQNT